MPYEFASTETDGFSLHDCWATSIALGEGKLTFLFPDGIACEGYGTEWPNTGNAAVSFATESATLYLFEEKDGRTLRKTFTAAETADKINAGEWELEFAYRHDGFDSTLFTCWVWRRDETPRTCEAEFHIGTTDTTYFWNAPEKIGS